MTEQSLGARIQRARDDAGLSVRQLSGRLGVAGKTLEGWEAGKSEPRPNKLMMIAGTLGVPVTWLLTGEETDFQSAGNEPGTETAALEQKVERALALQQELATLLFELSADLKRLQSDIIADEGTA